jgi:hypothetical protein
MVTASILLLPNGVRSQEGAPMASPAIVGKKVRLLAPAIVNGRIEGVVLKMDQQGFVIGQAEGTHLRVPRQTVTRLEVSTGRRRHTLKGMCIGAGVFVLLSTPIVVSGRVPARDAPLAAVAGAMWGAGIGTLVEGERWSAVPLGPVTPGPAERTTSSRLLFTVRF